MRRTLLQLSIIIVVGLLAAEARAVPAGAGPLIWEDEFEGSAPDNDKWRINEPGQWGDTDNTADAVSVSGGNLKITTYSTSRSGGYDHHAAVLGTQDTVLFTYGYFEARVQFNTSPGAWSAFWLMSPTIWSHPDNPGAAGTEIDIVEHRAVNDAGQDRTSHYLSALHWGGYEENHQFLSELHGPLAGLDNGTWNTYGLLWTPEAYVYYFNGQEMWRLEEGISHVQQYVLLSTLVENNSWAGNPPSGGYGTSATSQTNMLVDYVRVYAIPEPAGLAGLILLGLAAGRGAGRGRGTEKSHR